MLDCLNKSEVLRVNAQELEYHVLAPNEPSIDIEHIVMQARGEGHQRLLQAFSRQGANKILVASVARLEEHQRVLIILEQKRQELCQPFEQTSERQKLLAARLEKMWVLQKEAPDKFHEQMFLFSCWSRFLVPC